MKKKIVAKQKRNLEKHQLKNWEKQKEKKNGLSSVFEDVRDNIRR